MPTNSRASRQPPRPDRRAITAGVRPTDSWRDAQRRDQHRDWAAVDRALAALPPPLFRQAKLLEYDLALRWSATGQFRDIFLGAEAFPLTSIGRWLLHDLGVACEAGRNEAGRDEAGSHLLVAGVYLAARAYVVEAMFDPASFVGREHVALIEVLSERTMTELAAVVPAGSPFWERRASIAEDAIDALLADAARRRERALTEDPMALLQPVWSGPARILALAAVASEAPRLADRPGIEDGVLAMLDAVAEAVEIRDEVATLQRDLAEGRTTFPIATIARAAGLSLDRFPPPAVVLGAMIATGSLDTIIGTVRDRLLAGREIAVGAGLPTFAAYLGDAIEVLDERRLGLTMGAVPSNAISERSEGVTARGRLAAGTARRSGGRSAGPLFTVSEPPLPKAIAMAEGFMFADGALRESWEMHREGMFGPGDVWSRFPEGLTLEILTAHGHDVTDQIDDLLSFTVANGFRYYAHPWSAVDSDTVGVFMRLLPFAKPREGRLAALHTVLARLDEQVRVEGAVPVWIRGDEAAEAERPPALDLGESCGTVAAHLLLGLLTASAAPSDRAPAHDATVTHGAAALLGRIATVGLGANVDYPPLYALARFEQLIGRLSDSPAGAVLGDVTERARIVLAQELERACARGPRSAQEAALLTVACLAGGRDDAVDPSWQTTILKSQRFDGGWSGEPFAAAPNRGRSVTWYSSATLTTALCYDALLRTPAGTPRTTRPHETKAAPPTSGI